MKIVSLILLCLCWGIVFPGWSAAQDASFHVGLVTGSALQSAEELNGVQALIQKYGAAEQGGHIVHVCTPDYFVRDREEAIRRIVALADDPLMKAVIVNEGIPGTAEAFRRIRAKRPELLLFAGTAHDDRADIEAAADLVVDIDNIARGYLLVLAAKKLGANAFVHISFERHMQYQDLAQRCRIMQAACADLGLNFHSETALDPVAAAVGVERAQQHLLERMSDWMEKYGPGAAYFCTNDALTAPLLKRVLEGRGYMLEASKPSPLMGYPWALDLPPESLSGEYPALLRLVERAVVQKNGAGRLGTWAWSIGFVHSRALGELAMTYAIKGVTGKNFCRKFQLSDLLAVYHQVTPGTAWHMRHNLNPEYGTEKKNHILLYQDTYIFGRGYLGMSEVNIPGKYYTIR